MIARILGAVLSPWFLTSLAVVNVLVFSLSVTIPDDPDPFLGEWGPVSLLSGFQLLACGLLALEIHKSRPAWLWKLVGWGFFFLCADEMLQLHETGDRLIHWLFGLQESSLTDHIDDLLVGLYGLAGLVALVAGYREIAMFWRQWWIFAAGFLCFTVSVVLDITLTDVSLVEPYVDLTGPRAGVWLTVAEEGFKLAGGFCFVAALKRCWERLQTSFSPSGSMAGAVSA